MPEEDIKSNNKNDKQDADSLSIELKDTKNQYYLGKNRDLVVRCSSVKDEVAGKYVIQTTKPIAELSGKTAKAYSVVDKYSKESEQYYCVILDKRYPIRLAEINKLSNRVIENFTNVIAAQIIQSSLGKGRFFAVILQKPRGITLKQYIENNGPLSEEFVCYKVIPYINNVIASFRAIGITHGLININNIYIDENDNITLGECVSDICGHAQPLLYESINRASCLPSGKGSGYLGTDLFALGVTTALLLRGNDPTEHMDATSLLDAKFTITTYRLLTENANFSDRILDFLRAVLNDDKVDKWTTEQIMEWTKGRIYNLLPPADNIEASRPIVFADKRYLNMKHLAYGLYKHWDDAKLFLRDDTLIRWIERSVKNTELAEIMEIATRRVGVIEEGEFNHADALVTHCILLLDPKGPIRLKGFSANPDGIGGVLADAYAISDKIHLDAVRHIITNNIIAMVSSKVKKTDYQHRNDSVHTGILNLQRSMEVFRESDPGFGLERSLYILNQTLPCQSPKVLDEIPFNNYEMLHIIDNNESINGNILDKHMTAFISDRLDLSVKLIVPSLSKFPFMASNPYICNLTLMSLAQQSSFTGPLKHLSKKVSDSLISDVVEKMHSRSIKRKLEEEIVKHSKNGLLSVTLQMITDPKYIISDNIGYKRAIQRYRDNKVQLSRLHNRSSITNIGYRYGLQMSVLISFFIVTIVVLVLMFKTL